MADHAARTAGLSACAYAMTGRRTGMIDRSQADWYKDAIIYQLHIKAFFDANNDGIGDFRPDAKARLRPGAGRQYRVGPPFYPSPLRDDGYDIADYRNVNPSYGTMRDFRRFVRAAHERGLRVITELVINHTSDQHPWFQRARQAKPGSAHRKFYVWSDTDQRYQKPGSSSSTPSRRTGPGTRSPSSISGIASTTTSPTSTTTIHVSCARS